MASVNKVIIIGNLGHGPEMRYSADGSGICTISVATSTSWKDKATGEKREETEWHRIGFYNRLAGIAGEYLRHLRLVALLSWPTIYRSTWQVRDAAGCACKKVLPKSKRLGSLRAVDF
ncbi:single-stranded DNA-binding protein [Pusillimonas sp. ANT_WB101]|nr:single-stranded DNA-binding protein [Pusillimonas sp. ANT_WB101]